MVLHCNLKNLFLVASGICFISAATAFIPSKHLKPASITRTSNDCCSLRAPLATIDSNIYYLRRKTSLNLNSDSKEGKVKTEKQPPYPKIGDIVRYTDLDGGRADGQVLVGKIVLIQPVYTSSSNPDDEKQWLLEIAELDDVGDGYFGDYPMRERRFKRALRKLPEVSPILASFVRSADAYKIPLDENKQPKAWYEQYRMNGYEGPAAIKVDEEVVQSDGEKYGDLKQMLLRDAALVGTVGALITQLAFGSDQALIYAAGAVSGIGYLLFLSLKTDTLGSPTAKFSNNISNLRFALPFFVLLGVALRNVISGVEGTGYSAGGNLLSTVTKEQFGAAMIGFLTYRVPLLFRQLQPVVGESVSDLLPGSVGVAVQMAQSATGQDTDELVATPADDLTTIL